MPKNTNMGGSIDMHKNDWIIIGVAISLILFAAWMASDMAYGEEPLNFYGLDYLFEDPNSNVKMYSSGGFSLKNHTVGIMIFGHPEGEYYKMTVFVNGTVHRLLVDLYPIAENITEEPTSSVGADLSRWDIPTEGRSDKVIVIPEKEFDPNTLEIIPVVPHAVQYKHNFLFDFVVVDTAIKSEMDQKLENAWIEITMINPLNDIVGEWSGTTNGLGSHGDVWYVQDNEILGQYTLNATAGIEGFAQKTKLVSFFVMPLDSESGSECPTLYNWNGTHCVEVAP